MLQAYKNQKAKFQTSLVIQKNCPLIQPLVDLKLKETKVSHSLVFQTTEVISDNRSDCETSFFFDFWLFGFYMRVTL